MNVANSVRKAIDDWQVGELEAAMLHACNAVDGTAGKIHPATLSNKQRFTRLLRENFDILGPMGAPGVDLVHTRFPVVVHKPTAPGGAPDLADVLYAIHRCCHAHGDDLPDGFSLLEDAAGPARQTRMRIEHGKIQLSDRVIFGMIAVAVLSPANTDQVDPKLDSYFLSFGNVARLMINDWWGRTRDFPAIVALDPAPLVKLDFGDWMP